jgi:hypothetical protein
MEALAFARKLGTQLNAHATINWEDTNAGDDPDGGAWNEAEPPEAVRC